MLTSRFSAILPLNMHFVMRLVETRGLNFDLDSWMGLRVNRLESKEILHHLQGSKTRKRLHARSGTDTAGDKDWPPERRCSSQLVEAEDEQTTPHILRGVVWWSSHKVAIL
jgi:hypothetical protein